jgi:hypothetical protein
MVDVPITTNVSSAPTNAASFAGVQAPQTQAQRADVAATRVVNTKGASEGNIQQYSQEKTIDAIKSQSRFVAGANPFLSDMSFTIYAAGESPVAGGGTEYVIRFTDLSTGEIQVKSAPELFQGTNGGEIVNGAV